MNNTQYTLFALLATAYVTAVGYWGETHGKFTLPPKDAPTVEMKLSQKAAAALTEAQVAHDEGFQR